MLAMVVDHSAWLSLLASPVADVHDMFSSREARVSRPAKADFLDRRFDVDVEAEILDWMETHFLPDDDQSPLIESCRRGIGHGGGIEDLASGLWLLAEWVSHGTFRCMEGRGFLYIEPYIGGRIEDVGELYTELTWNRFHSSIRGLTEAEYSDAVVVDWMARRDELGETLVAKRDSNILATMQSHQRLSSSLHKMSAKFGGDPSTALFTRREWSSFLAAGSGGLNIGSLLAAGEDGDE